MIMEKLYTVLLAAILCPISSAVGATFTAEAQEGDVSIYSTATKPEKCKAVAIFTYFDPKLVSREYGWTSCGDHAVLAGEKIKVCGLNRPDLIAPIVDEVMGACENDPNYETLYDVDFKKAMSARREK